MRLSYYIVLAGLVLLTSCSHSLPEAKKVNRLPEIFPDYVDVTIPNNIAPLNFRLELDYKEAYACFRSEGSELIVKAKGGQFTIPQSKWESLLNETTGKTITVSVFALTDEWLEYEPFRFSVAAEPVDPYIAYRLIEPGYMLWNRMGIYQRNIEGYKESAIMENKLSGNNCMNCHSFRMQDPDMMLFHMRETYPATFMIIDGKIEKLNTKTDQTISFLVYPSWHPSGKYVAFSVNRTQQAFHTIDANRVEVFDEASDVVVYDVEKHEIVTTTSLYRQEAFETFPTFSPDGKTLYFCSAKATPMPENFEEVKYSLCSIAFDPETRTFGNDVDTLFNAETADKSLSFPRVSPDGKYLMYTLSNYGNFSIWHKEADLFMIDLATKEHLRLDNLNSDDVESYHSWSSNSRWVVFSSRRIDGLYTRPHFAYIDKTGQAHKPFLLPQKDVDYYQRLMKSYNIPEFIKGKVEVRSSKISQMAKKDPGINVKFVD